MTTPYISPPQERAVAFDLVRRLVFVSPVIVLAAGIVRGVDGAISAAIGLVLVAINFVVAARLIGWAAGRGLGVLQAVLLGGYLVRLAVLLGIVLLLEQAAFIDVATLVIVIAATHLGLLLWEMKYVSLTLAAPGLKPTKKSGLLPGPN
jgi:hypothetical protein